MKPPHLIPILAAAPTAVVAQTNGTTLSMTCAQARGIVASQGAVVLRTGPMTYDRYVRDGTFCQIQEFARPVWVRTADTPSARLEECAGRLNSKPGNE
jgi:hypothetical protein